MERMVQKTKRNIQMDIVKGLAIALVVIGHTRKPGWNFIYLFIPYGSVLYSEWIFLQFKK